MTIYDSVQRKKVEFVPIKPDEVRIYVCGPTVYDHAHLGHARSSLSFDVLRRVLEERGFSVKFVKNFTDIDDKIIKKMSESGETLKEITNRFENSYLSDMEALNVARADIEPRATESLDEIASFINRLIDNGVAYRIPSGDIYFDTSKDSQYLSISKRVQNEDERESRLDRVEGEKRNSEDFVLWKGAVDGDVISFKTEVGDGRPGWHIECSAMIEKHLAYKDSEYSIDIHGGGADLLFPHHENEASQSRCATGHELSKYWIHNGFVKIDGEKMSKSLGNSFFIRDALHHYSGELLRFYLLSTHYRQDFNFSEEELLNSKKRLDKIYRLKKRLYGGKVGEVNKQFRGTLLEALGDDLNISVTLSAIDNFISEVNEKLDSGIKDKNLKREALANIEFIDRVLGVGGSDAYQYFQWGVSESDKEKIRELIESRTVAKKDKQFDKADEIREELLSMSIQIMDTADGTLWERS
jgi:cysteinyl-tRNA synthetase